MFPGKGMCAHHRLFLPVRGAWLSRRLQISQFTALPPVNEPAQTSLAEFWWLLPRSLPPAIEHSWFFYQQPL